MPTATHHVRPINDLRKSPNTVLTALRRTGKPVLFTKNGKPEVMLIDAREVGQKISEREFARLIEEAEADIDAGRVEDFDKFIRRFKDAHHL